MICVLHVTAPARQHPATIRAQSRIQIQIPRSLLDETRRDGTRTRTRTRTGGNHTLSINARRKSPHGRTRKRTRGSQTKWGRAASGGNYHLRAVIVLLKANQAVASHARAQTVDPLSDRYCALERPLCDAACDLVSDRGARGGRGRARMIRTTGGVCHARRRRARSRQGREHFGFPGGRGLPRLKSLLPAQHRRHSAEDPSRARRRPAAPAPSLEWNAPGA
eukprot:gene12211-biopygen397